jgi:D-alanyl-lipoteichoic acid acyltransferase DltB (MBOAT superfamily)
VNIIVVFLLSGLWHGANWTFVVWGGYNACLLIIGRWLAKSSSRIKDSMVVWRELPSVVFTFLLATVGWVFFRANSITDAMAYLNLFMNRLVMGEFGPMLYGKLALCYCAVLVVVEWVQRDVVCPLQLNHTRLGQYTWVRWSVYYLVFLLTFFARGEEQTFIYFQF